MKALVYISGLLTGLFFAFADDATAQVSGPGVRLTWEDNYHRKAGSRGGRFVAKLGCSRKGVAAFMANQDRGTRFRTAGVRFAPGTFFAIFEQRRERGAGRVLALSDTGHWVFIRQSAISCDDMTDAERAAKKRLFDRVPQIAVAANHNGYFTTNLEACGAPKDVTISGAVNVKASVELGIAALELGSEAGAEVTIKLPEGRKLVRLRFANTSTQEYLIIEKVISCSGNDNSTRLTLHIGEEQTVSIDLKQETELGFAVDARTALAQISCGEEYDAYQRYLEERRVPRDWLRTVISHTAQWSAGFVNYSTCDENTVS